MLRQAVGFLSSASLGALGVTRLARRLSGRRHIIVTFHHVRSEGTPKNSYDTCPNISARSFRDVLHGLVRDYQAVPLRQLLENRGSRQPLLAVTFDDGWRDTYDVAFPILRELGIPATVFVTTGKLGSSTPFWQQRLGHAFRQAAAQPGSDLERALRQFCGLEKDKSPLTPDVYRTSVAQWKAGALASREARVMQLEQLGGAAADASRKFLLPSELQEMANTLFDVGSHSVNHPILPNERPEVITEELAASKKTLEEIIGREVDMLAYPNGSWDRAVADQARRLGYRWAFTCHKAHVTPACTPMQIPRYDIVAYPFGNETAAVARTLGVKRVAASSARARAGKAPLHVLFVIDQMARVDGGTEQHLCFLLNNLPRDQFRCHLALGCHGGRYDPAIYPVPPVFLLPGGSPRWRSIMPAAARLAALIVKNDVDIVHTFFPFSEAVALLALSLVGRAELVAARRNLGYWHTRATQWRSRLQNRLGHHILVNCEAVKRETMRLEWIPEERISTIVNPAPGERIREGLARPITRQELGIPADAAVVVIVGTIRPVKDHQTFLRAARLVLNRNPKAIFLVVGQPEAGQPLMEELLRLAASLGVEHAVRWLGSISNPVAVLPSCDVAVLSSVSEGLSNALIEYAAAGLPTVATDVGGNREVVIDGETGYVVRPGAADPMADRICQLLDNPNLRQRFGAAGRARVQTVFAEDRVLEQYAEFYRSILADRNPGAKPLKGGQHVFASTGH